MLSQHFTAMHDSPSNSNDTSLNNEDSHSKSPTSNSVQSVSAIDSVKSDVKNLIFTWSIYWFKNFWLKILKKYATSSSPQAASDQESIKDTQSVSSFNDLNQIFTTYTNQNAATREQQMEKELQIYKEKLQTAEEIRSICKF